MLELSSKGAGVQLPDTIFLPVYKQKNRFYVLRAVSCGYFLNQESGLRFKKGLSSQKGGGFWMPARAEALNTSRQVPGTQGKHGKNVLGKLNSDNQHHRAASAQACKAILRRPDGSRIGTVLGK